MLHLRTTSALLLTLAVACGGDDGSSDTTGPGTSTTPMTTSGPSTTADDTTGTPPTTGDDTTGVATVPPTSTTSDDTTSTTVSTTDVSTTDISTTDISTTDISTTDVSTTTTGDTTTGDTTTGGVELINGCDPLLAEDHTQDMKPTIMTVGFAYSPKCIRVSAGATVTFMSNFAVHPLVGGEVVGVSKTPDPNSPITMTNMGMMAQFDFPNAGSYGYYCDVHYAGGMTGAIFVE